MANKEEYFDIESAMNLLGMFSLHNIFGGMPKPEKYPHQRLGNGYELREIEIFDEEGKPVENRENFSHLYHNDSKTSDIVFRKGGGTRNFKDGYCELIVYTQREPHTKKRHGFDFGTHSIVNEKGEIVLMGDGITDYPSHYGGNVGAKKDLFYDLRTGKPFMIKSSDIINGENTIIVNHRYSWYSEKDLKIPLGIYLINKQECSFSKIDDTKK